MQQNNMLDVINCVDDGVERAAVVDELSEPHFYMGSRVTINRLLEKMIFRGFLIDENGFISVTPKGKEFYDTTEFTSSP